MITVIEKARPARWFCLIYAVLVMFFPSHTNAGEDRPLSECEARNDLLELPAVKSEKATSSLLLDITRAGNRLVTVGERGHILCSDDDGKSWQQADVPVMLTLTAVDFPNPQKGWAVGHDGVVLHTKDSGDSWVKQFDAFEANRMSLEYAQQMVAAKTAELEQAPEEAKSALRKQLDDLKYELEYWETAEDSCCVPLLDVWFKNSEVGFVIGAYGRFYKTSDGGRSWSPWWDKIDNPWKLHLNGFAYANDSLLIARESGGLYRSRDGGESWESLESPHDGSYLGIVASPTQDLLIAYGIGAKLVYSKDGGESWKLVQTKAGAALSGGAVRSDGSVLLISYSGIILAGSDKPETFVPKKIGVGWSAVAETEDQHIVLVGLKGVHRTAF